MRLRDARRLCNHDGVVLKATGEVCYIMFPPKLFEPDMHEEFLGEGPWIQLEVWSEEQRKLLTVHHMDAERPACLALDYI